MDLIGKGGHIRTVQMPAWAKQGLDNWTTATGITDGRVFRRVSRTCKVWGDGITQNVIWYVVKSSARKLGYNGSRRMICGAPARSCAIRAAASLSRFNSCWAMRQFRLPNDTSAASETWGTR